MPYRITVLPGLLFDLGEEKENDGSSLSFNALAQSSQASSLPVTMNDFDFARFNVMKGLSLVPLLVFAPSIFAATSAGLNVGGQVTPTSCDISISNGNFAFGDSIALNPTGNTILAASTTQAMSLTCSGLTYVGFRASDNRAGTAISTSFSAYGLGTDALGNKIGW